MIKIAESLRIKGLGDVSQRDPVPIVPSSKSEKRTAGAFQASTGRQRKSQKRVDVNGTSRSPTRNDLSSSFPLTGDFNYGSCMVSNSENLSGRYENNEQEDTSLFAESKLRSCLEIPDLPLSLPFTNLLSHFPSASRLGSLLKKDNDKKRSLKAVTKSEPPQDSILENAVSIGMLN